VIEYSPAGLAVALPHLRTLTRLEGLTGHGTAAEVRTEGVWGSSVAGPPCPEGVWGSSVAGPPCPEGER
jgi:hypothetical protein